MKKQQFHYFTAFSLAFGLGIILFFSFTTLPFWQITLLVGIPLITLFLSERYITRLRIQRIRKELFQVLETLEQFQIDAPNPVEFNPTKFSLFQELQEYLASLIHRIHLDYTANKQFTENAAHELQTPLAVIKGNIELLLQSSNIGEREYEALGIILQNTNRLSKINQALILLSKIEHKRFQDEETLDFENLLEEVLVNFKDTLRMYALEFSISIEGQLNFTMSKTLAEILLTNLIKNAIRHNLEEGFIRITIQKQSFIIENSGPNLKVAPSKLFKRFQRQSDANESLGLGLSIVKRICDLYDLEVSYIHSDNHHQIKVAFPIDQ